MMQRRLILTFLLTASAWLLLACGAGSEAGVRKTVEDAAQAVEAGLNQGDLSRVQSFFATEAEGANAAGLAYTWGALQEFTGGLTTSDRVQFHSFRVESIDVHEDGNLARAGYRLHLSIVRNGQVAFGFVATQNLALARMNGEWLISGGDQVQLSEVLGQWPLPDNSAP